MKKWTSFYKYWYQYDLLHSGSSILKLSSILSPKIYFKSFMYRLYGELSTDPKDIVMLRHFIILLFFYLLFSKFWNWSSIILLTVLVIFIYFSVVFWIYLWIFCSYIALITLLCIFYLFFSAWPGCPNCLMSFTSSCILFLK